MNKENKSISKPSLATILSLSVIILGMGCSSWATFNIWIKPSYVHGTKGNDFILINSLTQLSKSTDEGVDSTQLASSIAFTLPDKPLYPIYPMVGDHIGSLTIPALKREVPIIQGTDKEELGKGVGHFAQSVLPGEKDNCVFSGHRETVFRQLGDLKIGDQLIVKTSAGVFTYEVAGTRIVHEDDKTVIVPTEHAVLTLTTCYPFHTLNYFPDRYIVSANLIKSE